MTIYIRNLDGTYTIHKPFILSYGTSNVASATVYYLVSPANAILDTRNTPNITRISAFGYITWSKTFKLVSTSGGLNFAGTIYCCMQAVCTGVSGSIYVYSSNTISKNLNINITTTSTYSTSGYMMINAIAPEPITSVTIRFHFWLYGGGGWSGTWNYIYSAYGNPLVVCMTQA